MVAMIVISIRKNLWRNLSPWLICVGRNPAPLRRSLRSGKPTLAGWNIPNFNKKYIFKGFIFHCCVGLLDCYPGLYTSQFFAQKYHQFRTRLMHYLYIQKPCATKGASMTKWKNVILHVWQHDNPIHVKSPQHSRGGSMTSNPNAIIWQNDVFVASNDLTSLGDLPSFPAGTTLTQSFLENSNIPLENIDPQPPVYGLEILNHICILVISFGYVPRVCWIFFNSWRG